MSENEKSTSQRRGATQYVPSMHAEVNPDSDSDEVAEAAHGSFEITSNDRSILEEEEEWEKLLTGSTGGKAASLFGSRKDNELRPELRRDRRRERRRKSRRKSSEEDEQRKLMFEMEEGARKSDVSSQASSSSTELDKLNLRTWPKSKVSNQSYKNLGSI